MSVTDVVTRFSARLSEQHRKLPRPAHGALGPCHLASRIEPEIRNALEPFLDRNRHFHAREVIRETKISGCPIKPGNMVLLSFPAANRDPKVFPDADKVMIDRKQNPHAAFGLGIHRCVGSNLARMEMTVAIEEWLKRIPDFRLDPAGKVTWSEGTVRGPRQLPMLFGKAR